MNGAVVIDDEDSLVLLVGGRQFGMVESVHGTVINYGFENQRAAPE